MNLSEPFRDGDFSPLRVDRLASLLSELRSLIYEHVFRVPDDVVTLTFKQRWRWTRNYLSLLDLLTDMYHLS